MKHADIMMQRLLSTNTMQSSDDGEKTAGEQMRCDGIVAIGKNGLNKALFYWYSTKVRQQCGRTEIDAKNSLILTQIAEWLFAHIDPDHQAETKRGLLLMGGVGCGKTTAMLALRKVINLLADIRCDYRWDAYKRLSMGIVPALEVAQTYTQSPETFDSDCRRLILGIDDLGSEETQVRNYGNAIRPIEEMIFRRYADRKTLTIVTTNLTAAQLREKYSARFYDRMREMMQPLAINLESLRK